MTIDPRYKCDWCGLPDGEHFAVGGARMTCEATIAEHNKQQELLAEQSRPKITGLRPLGEPNAEDVAMLESVNLTTEQLYLILSQGSLSALGALRNRHGERVEYYQHCSQGARGCVARTPHDEHCFPKE